MQTISRRAGPSDWKVGVQGAQLPTSWRGRWPLWSPGRPGSPPHTNKVHRPGPRAGNHRYLRQYLRYQMVEAAATKATKAPAPPAPPARGASLSSHACTPKNEQTSVRIAANSTFQSASPGWNGPAKPAHLTTTAAYNTARRSFTATRDGCHHPLTTAPSPVSLQVGTERRGSTSGIGRYPPPGVLVPLASSRPGREPPLTHRGRCIMLRAPCTTRAMTGRTCLRSPASLFGASPAPCIHFPPSRPVHPHPFIRRVL